MKFLSWNCQGLGNPLTVQSLKALVANERPDLIFLAETKNQEVVLNRVRKQLRFSNFVLLNSNGLAGGMALFWNDQVKLTMDRSAPEFFDVICIDLMGGDKMRITCIHAPSSIQQRQLFWAELRFICTTNTLPWISVGDFNEVLYPWEKIGKRFADSNRMQAFRDLLHDCSLIDMESKGCSFT